MERTRREGPALKVLIVDDDEVTLALVAALLTRAGHEVETRARALGTTPVVLKDRPDVVLLDLSMPGIDGVELARSIRERAIATHVILHSSAPSAELEAACRAVGAIGSIPKGLGPAEFVARFDELARRAA